MSAVRAADAEAVAADGQTQDIRLARLVRRAQAGDEAAFAEAARLILPQAYALALALTQDAAVADDITQESLIQCWRKLGACRDGARFGSWFLAIVRRRAYRYLARNRPSNRESLSRDLPAVGSWPDALVHELLERMTELEPAQREVLVLRDLNGMGFGEIAQLLNLTEFTCRYHLSVARRRLRAMLDLP